MKIKKIKISRLRNEEWFQFFTEFKTLVEEQTPASMNISAQYSKFLSLYNDADDLLEQIRKSQYTTEIVKADDKRDTTYTGFRDVVKGMQLHFEPEKCRAAANLMIVFNQYGNVTRKNYSEETASIYNFLQEMRGRFAPDVETLGLHEWVDKLEEDNLAFSTLMMQRNQEASRKTNIKMKDVRKETEACYMEIVKRMEAVTILQTDHTLTDIVNKLNSNLTRYKNMLSQREGRTAQKSQLMDAIAQKTAEK